MVIHNFLNRKAILDKAEQQVSLPCSESGYLLSVGNLRGEKNYPRQIEVMRILKDKGIPIKWICVGSTVDKTVYREVMRLLEAYHLQDDFICMVRITILTDI